MCKKNQNQLRRQNYLAWKQEHAAPTLLGMASTEPSVAVRALLEFAMVHGIMLGPTALDIGCGKGRNALFLALHGFQVAAFDIVEEAISTLKKRA